MKKFAFLAEYLREIGILTNDNLFTPSPMSLALLMKVHDAGYVRRFVRGQLSPKEIGEIGLPWSEWLVERTLRAVSGTVLTAELALEFGLACHLAGGTHHAHPAYGSGFCIFNDLAVAASSLLEQGKVERVMILDCDVHQGDGTASFFANNKQVITVSWHCEENYPQIKQAAGINIAIPKGATDALYLFILKSRLANLLEQYRPDFIFYDAGVDVHQNDRLGYVNLTDDGIFQRDLYVLKTCRDQSIPVAVVIGGGYDRDERVVAKRHSLVHQAAKQIVGIL
ncbi:histone deacetylase [Marinomonas sp. 15G1-11]|uniref:Histone deacetylase n=1 Tax=Marinomonas phaeophyticola TaxID=3004091 RepID=A0ABT4JQM3_9GAMM|nr:histone deacetylase [Marinomonas sp. 15G1-11]MCZ2720540.1 histone deacetylase [Marinomonas sp. 15G1-11]